MSVRERRVRDNPPYLEAERLNSKGAALGNRNNGWGVHLRVSGLGSRVSGTGYQVRVRVRVRGANGVRHVQHSERSQTPLRGGRAGVLGPT
jgi:hypothetical protein